MGEAVYQLRAKTQARCNLQPQHAARLENWIQWRPLFLVSIEPSKHHQKSSGWIIRLYHARAFDHQPQRTKSESNRICSWGVTEMFGW